MDAEARDFHTHTAGIFVGGASDDLGKREGVALGLEGEFARPDQRPIYDYSRQAWLKKKTD